MSSSKNAYSSKNSYFALKSINNYFSHKSYMVTYVGSTHMGTYGDLSKASSICGAVYHMVTS